MTVTTDEVFEELRRLEGKFVSVSLHPTGEWGGSGLHAQGRLRQNVVDQPERGIACGIGRTRRLNNDWAEIQILATDIESAAWRGDIIRGKRVLALAIRGGALLVFVP